MDAEQDSKNTKKAKPNYFQIGLIVIVSLLGHVLVLSLILPVWYTLSVVGASVSGRSQIQSKPANFANDQLTVWMTIDAFKEASYRAYIVEGKIGNKQAAIKPGQLIVKPEAISIDGSDYPVVEQWSGRCMEEDLSEGSVQLQIAIDGCAESGYFLIWTVSNLKPEAVTVMESGEASLIVIGHNCENPAEASKNLADPVSCRYFPIRN